MSLGAIILAGGRSARMGADKSVLLWNGRRAVDLVHDVARAAGAEAVLVAGPATPGLRNVAEEPAGGGPVAGLCAAAAALRAEGCARALVLAADAPTLAPADLSPLIAAPSPGAAAAHLHLPLVIDLDAIPAGAGAGWSVARLITEAGLRLIDYPADVVPRLRGANTPEERDALLRELAERQGAQERGAD